MGLDDFDSRLPFATRVLRHLNEPFIRAHDPEVDEQLKIDGSLANQIKEYREWWRAEIKKDQRDDCPPHLANIEEMIAKAGRRTAALVNNWGRRNRHQKGTEEPEVRRKKKKSHPPSRDEFRDFPEELLPP